MLVLGALVVISTIVVEFAYNSHIAYEVASSERDRLEAYYLARSAFNLIRLEIKVENQIRSQFDPEVLKTLRGSGVTSDPLCKQLPLSTGLLKGISSGALGGTPPPETQPAGEPSSEAKDFLDFNGDFEVTCDTEERKLNLNVFWVDPSGASSGAGGAVVEGAPPPVFSTTAVQAYEDQKNMLFSLLSQKEFESIFGGKPDEIHKVVNSIADWADRDDRVNEAPGVTGESEDSQYNGDYAYKSKNGKYQTLAELLLIPGIGDDLYNKLSPSLTVYGDGKVNLCQSDDEMIKAFVTRATLSATGVAPISPNDDDRWNGIIQSVRTACDVAAPQPADIANAIAVSVGLPAPANALAGQIKTTNRFYRIEATGRVRESQVRIIAIVDVGSGSNSSKILYFRVE